jgi:SAM-dependent methyltransferase
MSDPSTEPHSAAVLNTQRNFWWHGDFLQLIARRLGLDRVGRVLDVGTGVGHWATTLMPVLAPDVTVVGVDREPQWVELAQERVVELGVADRCRFLQAAAEDIPFPDASFDLVTCQTLLIHVSEPMSVVAEMQRVVRPGGLLLLSEPNNLAGMLVADSVIAKKPVAYWVERLEFALICERGKAALGEGNNSIGDLLPGMLAQAGLIDIRSFINDRSSPLLPPYAPAEQQELKNVILKTPEDSPLGWLETDTKRYFVAGGGDPDEFERRWQLRLDEHSETARELRAGHLQTAGGGIHYLISGRRPT